MTTWREFAAAAPDLAAFGYERINRKVSYIATVRANGPRCSTDSQLEKPGKRSSRQPG